MSSALATMDRRDLAGTMEDVIAKGDLKQLTPTERAQLYIRACESVGANPMMQPFDYIELDGKLTLYPNRKLTDQLGAMYGVSITIVKREVIDGIYLVTARATTPDGRSDEAVGAVPLVKENGTWKTSNSGKKYLEADGTFSPLSPQDKANAMMKGETKARRRVVLGLISLGWARGEAAPAPSNVTVRPAAEPVPIRPAAINDGLITSVQRAAIMARCRELGIDHETRHQMLTDRFGKDSIAVDAPNPLTTEEAEMFSAYLEAISGSAPIDADEPIDDETVEASWTAPDEEETERIAWSERIESACEDVGNQEVWKRLVADAGGDEWRWVELMRTAPMKPRLATLHTQAVKAGAFSGAVKAAHDQRLESFPVNGGSAGN